MSKSRRDRMAKEIGAEIRAAKGTFTAAGRHHDSAYALKTLTGFGSEFVEAALRGEIGRTNVTRVGRDFSVRDSQVRALLEQVDGLGQLNFLTAAIVKGQIREVVREITATDPCGQLVFVRTQPTSPTTGIRVNYGLKKAFGLISGRKVGTFDAIYATFASPFDEGHEQSISLAGLVPALDKDREEFEASVPMDHLSPHQHLSLTRPTAAMLRQAGAVDLAARPEIPPEVEAAIYIFLQGRYEGVEESYFLANPTHTVPIVNEEGYQKEARLALGDEVDVVIEAEGVIPYDRGLEGRHVYVDSEGHAIDNEEVRRKIDRELVYKLDKRPYIPVEHRDVVLMLMPGELRAALPDGRHEGGQAILQMAADGALRWFVLLNKANGSRAWRGDEAELRERLQNLAEAFALLDAPDSTAGHTRREQYRSLELLDVPMSNPSGRQNIWALAAARRQGDLPDAPLGAPVA